MATVLGALQAESQDCPELVGRVPDGPTRAAELVGTFVYYGSGSMLKIADVSDPEAPVVVGEVQMPDLVVDIEVEDGYAHVACGFEGYAILDVSVPSEPVLLGRYVTGPFPGWAFAGGVAVSGSLAFVADGSPGLTILDVSDPGAIRKVGEAMVLNSFEVEVRGKHAYLAGWDGFAIVDVGDPVAPVIVGTAPGGSEGFYGLAVAGDYAYAAASGHGVTVFDVRVPSNPTVVNTIVPPAAFDVAVSDGLLYSIDGYEFWVYDLTDPAAPMFVGVAEVASTKGMAVAGDLVAVAGHDRGVTLVDVSDPVEPAVAGGLGGVGWTLSVAANASLMVAPGSGSNLRIFDVTQPANPVQIGVLETEGPFWDLAIVGDFVYTANSSSARIIDLSDPTAPVDVGSMGRAAIGFAVSGNHLYSVSDDHGLTVIDISNPGSPSLRGSVTLPDSARKVAVTNGHAYVPVRDHGLQIVDVNDPSHPAIVGSYGAGESFSDVAAADNHVLVTSYDDLRILDVSNPVSPFQVAFYDPEGNGTSVDVSGDLVYSGAGPLEVLDIEDPFHPVFLGELDWMLAPGRSEQVKVVGDLVYLAHYIGGLTIVRGCHAIFVDGFETGDPSAWSTATAD